MKNRYETIKEVKASFNGGELTIPKGTELIHVPNCGDASGYAVKDKAILEGLGVWSHDADHYYAYVPAAAVFAAKHVRDPITTKGDDWQKTANKWVVSIGKQSFDYYTGSGIKDSPDYDGVVHSLVMDSDALTQEFEDWAEELGYGIDSRKAYETWEACCTNARKLIKAGVDIGAERERLADY